jgi:hypothetical protein
MHRMTNTLRQPRAVIALTCCRLSGFKVVKMRGHLQ